MDSRRILRGAELPQTRLTDPDLKGIMLAHRDGLQNVEIAKIYMVHPSHISRIVRGAKGGRSVPA